MHDEVSAYLNKEHELIKRQLEALTPGGSEFHDDPKRCIQWIKDRLAGPFVSVKTENEQLKQQLEAERARVAQATDNYNTLLDNHIFEIGRRQQATQALAALQAPEVKA